MAKTCKAMPWYGKTMVSMARFCQVIQSFGHFLKVYVQLWPSYTKSWQDMTKLCNDIQVMAKYGKCKVIARYGQFIQRYVQKWQCYAKLQLKLAKLYKVLDNLYKYMSRYDWQKWSSYIKTKISFQGSLFSLHSIFLVSFAVPNSLPIGQFSLYNILSGSDFAVNY